jgi:hypothetical protein
VAAHADREKLRARDDPVLPCGQRSHRTIRRRNVTSAVDRAVDVTNCRSDRLDVTRVGGWAASVTFGRHTRKPTTPTAGNRRDGG